MFCPTCGQKQVSPGVKYCSRCGFSLRGVLSIRRKDIVQGTLIMFLGLMIIFGFHQFVSGFVDGLMGAAGADVHGPNHRWSSDFILRFFSVVFVIWGFSRIIIALVTERNSRRAHQREVLFSSRNLPMKGSGSPTMALPQSRSIPIVEPGTRRMDTAALEKPSSVTEETTRPLER